MTKIGSFSAINYVVHHLVTGVRNADTELKMFVEVNFSLPDGEKNGDNESALQRRS